MNRYQKRIASHPTPSGVAMRHKVYETIVDYCREHGGNFPTYRELCDLCGLASTQSVSYHIDALISEGRLEQKNYRLMVVGAKWTAPKEGVR